MRTLAVTSVRERSPLPSLGDLVARVDLYALVERYAGPGRASGATTQYRCPNPAHEDRSPSFSVTRLDSGKLRATCFSEGWSGDALDLVKWLEGVSTAEAARTLRAFIGEPEGFGTYSERVRIVPAKPVRKPAQALEDTAKRPEAEKAREILEAYLDWRAWPSDIAERFGLEVVLDKFGRPRVRHTFFVPSPSGEWVAAYWQDRGGRDAKPKWISCEGASPVLYNLRSLEAEGLEAVVVCEGPADTITASLALEEYPHVAVIGVPGVHAWRTEWAEYLEGLRVVVAADNDEAGRTLEASVVASLGAEVVVVRPSTKDLSELLKSEGLAALVTFLLSGLEVKP